MDQVMHPVWKVLAPIDLSAETETSVQHAIDVASTMAADLQPLICGRSAMVSTQTVARLAIKCAGGSQTNCEIHRLVLTGKKPETITRYADFMEADLVLMTSRSFGAWTRLWKGCTPAEVMEGHAEAGVRHECPVVQYGSPLPLPANSLRGRSGRHR